MALAVGGRDAPAGSAGFPGERSLAWTRELEAAARQADRALCRLAGAAAALPGRGALARMLLRQEAVASCILDGGSPSLPDLLAVEAGLAVPGAGRKSAAAARCFRALDAALGRPLEDALSPGALEDCARGLRETDGSGKDGEGGAAVSPEPAGSASAGPPRRGAFFRRVAAALVGDGGLPAVVRTGLALASTELAGPFGAAAGRTGRAVAVVDLAVQCGTAVPLSVVFRRRPGEYRDRLGSAARSGAWSEWTGFFLRCVAEASAGAAGSLARCASLREDLRADLAANLGYALPKALVVLDRLFRQPVATVADVQRITGTSYVAANTLVARLADLGVLEEVTGHRRNRVFWLGPYLRALDWGAPASAPAPAAAPQADAAPAAPPDLARGTRGPSRGKAGQASPGGSDPRGRPAPVLAPGRPAQGLPDHLL